MKDPYGIDWDEQSALHSPFYKEGRICIDLSVFSPSCKKELSLLPGPGFGDLSHPTTHLTLSLMPAIVKEKRVIDIGCGNGILTLASVYYGAVSAYGVDICPYAIEHASENAKENACSQCLFSTAELYSQRQQLEDVFLLNMIRSEQAQAWKSLASLHTQTLTGVVSGVMASEQSIFEEEAKERSWVIKRREEREGWLAFIIEQRGDHD